MRRLSLLTILFAASALVPAYAALPASERQVLLNLYASAGGASWIQSYGWASGDAGTECGNNTTAPWFGVICNAADTHVIGIYLVQNNLAGTLPSLAALAQLQSFNVANNNSCSGTPTTQCSLGGAIPDLSALTQLQSLSLDGNGFGGSIPSLATLTDLQGIDLSSNQLTGSIPALDGLTHLRGFNVAGNQLSGSIPALASLSALQMFDSDHNGLTGSIPSLRGLANLQTFYAFANQLSGSIPTLTGLNALQFFNVSNNQLTGAIPALGGLSNLQNFAVDSNQLSGSIPNLSGLASLNVLDVGNNQLSGLIPPLPSANMVADQSILCANGLMPTPDPDWDKATGVTPWYSACGLSATTVNLDQFGLTGSWYNPLTSGQGFQLGIYPDSLAAGKGQIFLSWYTFVPASTTVSAPNWYSLQGTVDAGSSTATLTIYASNSSVYGTSGGVFNAPPPVNSRAVGSAVVSFADCTHGTLLYQFSPGYINFGFPSDIAAGLGGTIPLTRVTANTNCGQNGDNGAAPSDALLSGAWYNPATSGQGLVFDINPSQNLFSAGWYTFPPSGVQGGYLEPWYTIQTTSFTPGSTTATATISTSTGGFFDDPTTATPVHVGTATVTFQSCSTATLTYTFSSGLNQDLSGTINLQRIGPIPAGCSL
jgi:hypothetical protein